jgi:hypothetical protein
MHTISVYMSALQHSQVGDKEEWSDNRDYLMVEIPTHVNIALLMAEPW